ncbi:hypothetical protein LTSEINV_1377 [Salmonella enterica subsp. enterica serovar Inverness str. R8-3668]|uniref:Uncharacterized protein n=1 Tax=Salmonella enterica subsp. enterica serovar Inverness str. R8-3668 TaxID=913075 RepID=G5NAA3_SALET|nr:hypothetical protein LTSEINV_1377 [Salmonella enterica subsp. enterica serovar Inverness str. R8-3668]
MNIPRELRYAAPDVPRSASSLENLLNTRLRKLVALLFTGIFTRW